jgi:hypothetical protein
VRSECPEAVLTPSERRVIEEIWKKKRRGEKLTDREEAMLAYSPYGTAARSSFQLVVRTHTDQEQ